MIARLIVLSLLLCGATAGAAAQGDIYYFHDSGANGTWDNVWFSGIDGCLWAPQDEFMDCRPPTEPICRRYSMGTSGLPGYVAAHLDLPGCATGTMPAGNWTANLYLMSETGGGFYDITVEVWKESCGQLCYDPLTPWGGGTYLNDVYLDDQCRLVQFDFDLPEVILHDERLQVHIVTYPPDAVICWDGTDCPSHVIAPAQVFCAPPQIEIIGSLSNFDAHQGSFDFADNFELDLYGEVNAGDFTGWYPGWGAPPRFDEIEVGGVDLGSEVLWLNRAEPIPYCQWIHFGVGTNPALPPLAVRAWWTRVVKEAQIPVPFQWWAVLEEEIQDVLTLSPTFEYPLLVRREYAVNPVALPLDLMQYDSTPVAWTPFGDTVLNPGDVDGNLIIPFAPGMESYLVRYTVSPADAPATILTRFVTQAVAAWPDLVDVLINFDVYQNDPTRAYTNLELDLFGDWITPQMIRAWYDLPGGTGILPAWGTPPLVRRFPAGMFPAMPERSGVEVTWVDKFTPFEYGDIYHFGIQVDPALMGPLPMDWTWVQAYWTTILQEPVPVPWQVWAVDEPGVVTDIITLDGPTEAWVSREYAVINYTIPLEDLLWSLVDPLPWTPVPGDPVIMMTGDRVDLQIPVAAGTQAVLVRYTVDDPDGETVSRVINEALVEVGDPSGVGEGNIPAPDSGLELAPQGANPARGGTALRFRLPEPAEVSLSVVDATGRRVAEIFSGRLEAGEHHMDWDGRTTTGAPAESGIYFYVLKAGTRMQTARIILTR